MISLNAGLSTALVVLNSDKQKEKSKNSVLVFTGAMPSVDSTKFYAQFCKVPRALSLVGTPIEQMIQMDEFMVVAAAGLLSQSNRDVIRNSGCLSLKRRMYTRSMKGFLDVFLLILLETVNMIGERDSKARRG